MQEEEELTQWCSEGRVIKPQCKILKLFQGPHRLVQPYTTRRYLKCYPADESIAALCGLEHVQEVVQHLTPTVKAAAVAVGFLKLDSGSGPAPQPSRAAALCRRGCTKVGCCMGTARLEGPALEAVLAKAKQERYLSLRCVLCSKELCTLVSE